MNPPPQEQLDELLALRPRLTLLARRLLADEHGAEDLVQEAWIRALERPPGGSLAGWMTRVVRNLALDRRRSDRRRNQRERRAAFEAVDHEPGPEELEERLLLQREILDAVLQLEEPLRSTLHSRYFDELPPRKIAERDGVSINTVNDRLRRARRQLREHLSTHLEGGGPSLSLALLPLADLSSRAQLTLSQASLTASGTSAAAPLIVETALMKKTLLACVAVVAAVGTAGLYLAGLDAPETPQAPGEVVAEVGGHEETSEPPMASTAALPPEESTAAARKQAVDLPDDWVVDVRAKLGLSGPAAGIELLATVFAGMKGEEVLHQVTLHTDEQGLAQWTLPPQDGTVRLSLESQEPDAEQLSYPLVVPQGTEPQSELELTLFPLDRKVTGTVRDQEGNAVSGAVVTANEAVTTGEDGRYSLPISSFRNQTYVSCKASGFAGARLVADAGQPGQAAQADFVLRPEVFLKGRVVDELDRPVEGVAIRAFLSHTHCKTDATGEFELHHLDPGHERHSIMLQADGFVAQGVSVETRALLESPEPVTYVLERGAQVQGQVVDIEEQGVAGATVSIGFSPNAWDLQTTYCDEDGRFTFKSVGSGEQKIWVRRQGMSPGAFSIQVDPDQREVDDVRLILRSGRTLAGRVLQMDGSPAPEMWVAVRHHGEGTALRTQCDEQGAFVLENVPQDGVQLSFWGDGWLRTKMTPPPGPQDSLYVLAERSGRIAGQVIDAATGAPLRDFVVRLTRAHGERGDLPIWASWVREGHRFTNEEGRWDTTGLALPPGAGLAVYVQAEGYAPTRIPRAEVGSEAVQELVIAMSPGARVQGQVVDASGTSIEGATVRLELDYTGKDGLFDNLAFRSWTDPVTLSQAQGEFAFGHVGPGRYVVWVEHPDYPGRVRSDRFDILEGSTPPALLIQLGGGLFISGVVLDASGDPKPEARVSLRAVEVSSVVGDDERTTTVDSLGRFRFQGLREGLYSIVEQRGDEDHNGLGVVLRGDQGADLTLEPRGTAILEVTFLCELELDTLSVVLHTIPEGRPSFPLVMPFRKRDIEGSSVTFRDLPAGNYQLEAYGYPGGQAYKCQLTLELDEGQQKSQSVQLEPR